MQYHLECTYCGEKWKLPWPPKYPACGVCKDKKIKVTTHEKGNFFGYEETKKEDSKYNDGWGSD